MADDVKEKLVREAVRLAELNLASELSIMTAADQRAATFAGILVAAIAVTATIYDYSDADWTANLGQVILACSAIAAIYSIRSVKAFVPGNRYDSFLSDIKSRRDITTVLSDLGKIYDAASDANRITIRRNAKCYNSALLGAIVGFVVTLIPAIFSLGSALLGFLLNAIGAKP